MKHVLLCVCIVTGAIFSGLMSSCSSDSSTEPVTSEPGFTVRLHPVFITDREIREYQCDASTGTLTLINRGEKEYSYAEDGLIGHNIRIYKLDKSGNIGESVYVGRYEKQLDGSGYDTDLYLSLPEGDYRATMWTCFKIETSDYLYTANSNGIISLSGHPAGELFVGTADFSVTGVGTETDITMKRPGGEYAFIMENIGEACIDAGKLGDYTVKVNYSWFFPNKYNIFTDRLTDSSTDDRFICKFTPLKEGIQIAGDFMMMNEGESGAKLTLNVCDGSGVTVAQSAFIDVPIWRNTVTIIKGALKPVADDDGGFGLNPDFDGDFIITPEY